jgi:hypothetical protein
MQHSAFKDRGESVDIFAQTNKPDSLKVFKILDDDTFTDITPEDPTIDSLGANLRKTNLTMPDENSIVVSFLNEQPVFTRVGNPKIRFTFFAGKDKTGLEIPYDMLNQDDGDSIESGNLTEYGEGLYGFCPENTGDAIIKVKGLVFPLRVPYVVDSAGMAGSIYLQKNAWMMLAVPKEDANIYDDFIKKIEDQTGKDGNEIFEVFNAYPYTEGPNGSSRQFLSFVPGVTNPASSSNFQLIYEDSNGEKEITGFWCKTLDYEGDVITYNWDATT